MGFWQCEVCEAHGRRKVFTESAFHYFWHLSHAHPTGELTAAVEPSLDWPTSASHATIYASTGRSTRGGPAESDIFEHNYARTRDDQS